MIESFLIWLLGPNLAGVFLILFLMALSGFAAFAIGLAVDYSENGKWWK